MKQMSDKFNTGISITPCDIGVSGVVTLYHYFLMYIKLKEMMRNSCLTPTVAKPFHKQVYDKVTTIRLQK